MPRVGSKHFAYTAKGQKKAAAEARRTGKKMKNGNKNGKRRSR